MKKKIGNLPSLLEITRYIGPRYYQPIYDFDYQPIFDFKYRYRFKKMILFGSWCILHIRSNDETK